MSYMKNGRDISKAQCVRTRFADACVLTVAGCPYNLFFFFQDHLSLENWGAIIGTKKLHLSNIDKLFAHPIDHHNHFYFSNNHKLR